jgi:hypothetical protein
MGLIITIVIRLTTRSIILVKKKVVSSKAFPTKFLAPILVPFPSLGKLKGSKD